MTSVTSKDLLNNLLLGVLTEHDRERLTLSFQAFDLHAGDILQGAGEHVEHTWFPCGAAIAAFCVDTEDGDSVEVALVGREGAVGGIVSNGNVPAFATARVRSAGKFLRIKITALEQSKLDSLPLRHWFARYSDCLLAQVFQTAMCNARHTIIQRTGKWLLAAAERTSSSDLEMTQEHLASLLGVSRTFVNRTLQRLKQDGAIITRRGRITIADKNAVKAQACDCSATIESHFEKVLHGVYH